VDLPIDLPAPIAQVSAIVALTVAGITAWVAFMAAMVQAFNVTDVERQQIGDNVKSFLERLTRFLLILCLLAGFGICVIIATRAADVSAREAILGAWEKMRCNVSVLDRGCSATGSPQDVVDRDAPVRVARPTTASKPAAAASGPSLLHQNLAQCCDHPGTQPPDNGLPPIHLDEASRHGDPSSGSISFEDAPTRKALKVPSGTTGRTLQNMKGPTLPEPSSVEAG